MRREAASARRPRSPAEVEVGTERLLALAVLGLVAVLTLEWVTLGGVAGGFVKPFHLAAAVLGGLAILRWGTVRLLSPVVRSHRSLYLAYAVMVAVSLAGGLAYRTPYMSHAELVRVASYALTSVVVAGVVARLALRPRGRRILAFTGLATVVTVLVGLVVSLTAANVDPVSLLRRAVSDGNPDIVSNQLLRVAFRTGDDLAEVSANLRHKVFLAVALGLFVGLAFLPTIARRHRATRGLLLAGAAVAVMVVVFSFSRSALLCLVLPLVLMPIRLLIRKRLRMVDVALVIAGLGVLGALALSPVADLVSSRLGETGSYESRLEVISPSFFADHGRAALLGADRADVDRSPHNFVLDAWLAGGVVGALAVVVMLVAFGRLWLRMLRGYLIGDDWALPVERVWVLGIGFIPLVRSVTAGNQFHLVEWAAIGIFVGTVMANRRAAAPGGRLTERPKERLTERPAQAH